MQSLLSVIHILKVVNNTELIQKIDQAIMNTFNITGIITRVRNFKIVVIVFDKSGSGTADL